MCLDRDVFEDLLPFSRMGILIFKLYFFQVLLRLIQLIIFLSRVFMTILYV